MHWQVKMEKPATLTILLLCHEALARQHSPDLIQKQLVLENSITKAANLNHEQSTR